MSKILFDEAGASSYKKKAKAQINADEGLKKDPEYAKEKNANTESQLVINQEASTIQKKETLTTLKVTAPVKEETRSKAVNFKIKPSLKAQFKKKCAKIGVSQNNAIEQLLEIFVNMEE